MKFQLVLPCYNESQSIKQIIDRAILSAEKGGFTSQDFNLVLVENGSKDNSRQVMSDLKKDQMRGPWFEMVKVDVNQGYGHGLWQGLLATKANVVGWSHADQQCDPQDAMKAYEILMQAGEPKVLVKGVRLGRSLKEKVVSRVFDFFAWILLRFFIYEINAQPKVFKRELLQHIQNPPKDFAFDIYVLYQAFKNKYKFITFTVEFPSRIHGLSNWAFSLKNRFKVILNMICYMYRLGRRRI